MTSVQILVAPYTLTPLDTTYSEKSRKVDYSTQEGEPNGIINSIDVYRDWKQFDIYTGCCVNSTLLGETVISQGHGVMSKVCVYGPDDVECFYLSGIANERTAV